MDNQMDIDPNLLLTLRQLWRLSREDLPLFCARYGVSDDMVRKLLVSPPAPKTKTLLPVMLV